MLGSKSTGEDSIIAKYVLKELGWKEYKQLVTVCVSVSVCHEKNIATGFNDVGFKVDRQVLMIWLRCFRHPKKPILSFFLPISGQGLLGSVNI